MPKVVFLSVDMGNPEQSRNEFIHIAGVDFDSAHGLRDCIAQQKYNLNYNQLYMDTKMRASVNDDAENYVLALTQTWIWIASTRGKVFSFTAT